MLGPRRIALHGAAAEFFEGRDLVLCADHLGAAEDRRAPEAYLKAYAQQFQTFRLDTALRLLDSGLKLDLSDAVRFDFLCHKGDLLRELGQIPQSIEVFEESLQVSNDDVQESRALLGKAEGLRVAERSNDALELLDRAQSLAEGTEKLSLLADIHFLRGNLMFPLGKFAECLAEHEASLAYAREIDSPEAMTKALGGIGDATYVSGRMKSANEAFLECIALAKENRLRRVEVANKPMLSHMEFFVNRFESAIAIAHEAVEDARASGNSRAELVAQIVPFEVFCFQAEYVRAREHGKRCADLGVSIGANSFEIFDGLSSGFVEFYENRNRRAAFEHAKEAFEISKATMETFMGPWIMGAAALFAETAEERSWALSEGSRILDRGAVGHNYFFFHTYAMQALIHAGENKEAKFHADKLQEFIAAEPFELAIFFVNWGTQLTKENSDLNRNALLDLMREGQDIGVAMALPMIEDRMKKAVEIPD